MKRYILTMLFAMAIIAISSCGLDKLKNNVEYDFYIMNETESAVNFTLYFYHREHCFESSINTKHEKTHSDIKISGK